MKDPDRLFIDRFYKQPRQVSLFNFKSEAMRHNGLTPAEERELIIAACTGEFPRRHRVERTGTEFVINTPEGAERLLKNLKFSNAIDRKQLAA